MEDRGKQELKMNEAQQLFEILYADESAGP